MKHKLVTIFISLMLATSLAVSGDSHIGKKAGTPLSLTGDEAVRPMSPSSYRYAQPYAMGPGDSIGWTTYDYGTNGSANHNVVNYGDGKLSLGRMAAHEPVPPPVPDRGTWYSHSTNSGATWRPLVKVETASRGWSNIDQFRSTEGAGIEVTVAHVSLEININVERGGNAWSSVLTNSTAAATWPRLAVGGGLNIHVIAGAGNPPTGYIYTRSTDAGLSFSPLDMPVMTTSAPSADGWDIAARGNKIVLVGTPQAAGSDVVIQVSTDNGTTWATQTIYNVAGLGELPTGQQQPQPDGSSSVVMDNAGNIHVTWGNMMAIGSTTNDPELFYSFDAGIMHWSSATGVRTLISEAPVQDTSIANLAGAPGRDGNFASQPDIGVDAANNLYVVFSSLTAGLDSAGAAYEHAYASRSTNGGLTWTPAVDITPGTGFDAGFPSLADLVDTHLHIVYNSDIYAGNSVQSNHPINQTAIMFLKVPVTALLVDVPDEGRSPEHYALAQNYPNPFNPSTNIEYAVAKAGPVAIEVFNVLGQKVATLLNEELQPGTYQATFDASRVASGIYYYKMTAGSFTETKKMILMK